MSYKRCVTLVSGEFKRAKSRASGKMYPSKLLSMQALKRVKPEDAIEWFEDMLENEEYEEFLDAKKRNHVVTLLERYDEAQT